MNDDDQATVETVRPLEALHRLARQLHATVCLCSTCDGVEVATGHRRWTRIPGARLAFLTVVKPHPSRDLPRRDRLMRGNLLARATLADSGDLDMAAAALLESIGEVIGQTRKTTPLP